MQENDFLADILCNDDAQYIPQAESNYIFPEDFHDKFKNHQVYFSPLFSASFKS